MAIYEDDTNPPTTILAAFFGYLVSTVIAVGGVVVLFQEKHKILSALRSANARSGGNLTQAQIGHAATVAQAVGIAVLIVIALIYLVLAFRLKAGRNWARITLTVITILQAISLVTAQGTILSYISTIVAVIALLASYLPESNAYLRRVRSSR